MDPILFKKFASLARLRIGIELPPGKEAMLAARMSRRARKLGLEGPREYFKYLQRDESGAELVQFVNAVTTNHTFFFRESEHFEGLARWATTWLAAGHTRLRVWSAASSSGEEPYSIAMVLSDVFQNRNIDWSILATDISTEVLAKARAGVYSPQSVSPLSRTQRAKYMRCRKDAQREPIDYTVHPAIKDRILFRRLNLATPPLPMKGPIDVVFCRNVMIYFGHDVRSALVAEIERLLRPGGLLMIGHAETLTGLDSGLRVVKPSVYRKDPAASAVVDGSRVA